MPTKVWVFDLDGVLADASHRGVPCGDPEDYFRDLEKDPPMPEMQTLVRVLSKEYKIIILTGRSEQFRARTSRWLTREGFPYNQLYMRPRGFSGSISEYKGKILDSLLSSGYLIQGYFEDNPLSVAEARKLGIPTVYVYSGYYEMWDPREILQW